MEKSTTHLAAAERGLGLKSSEVQKKVTANR
jgi:hypothetical protein